MPAMAKPWSSFTSEEQRVLAREMEVYAAMAEHTDYEIGRLIQAIEDLGELDNTLVVWVAGDNGGAPFGGPIGSFNQLALFKALNDGELAEALDDLVTGRQRALRHAMGEARLHTDGRRAGM
jgi:arylsulfatase